MNASPADDAARLLVVDDHPLLRQGLVQLLSRQPDLLVCGEADSVHAAAAAADRLSPELILLDLRLGSGDSLELIKSLRQRHPSLRILVLSQHDEMIYAERAMRAGADGYITKQEAPDEVLNAVRSVIAGETYVSRRVAVLLFRKTLDGTSAAERANVASLSDRELHVFQLLGAGRSTREIAAGMNLSIKTVETYRENIKHKLNLANAEALVERARAWVVGDSAAGL